VRYTGLVEVPIGVTMRQLVNDIGGGVPGAASFKAAQMGGPSGGCVPAQYLDMPIDYETVKEVGAIMGSGGLIILDDATCMVDLARYFMDFCAKESCGKCPPCRIGTTRMLEILQRICAGKGAPEDIAAAGRVGKPGEEELALRAWPDGAQPGIDDHPPFPVGVRSARQRQALSRRCLPRPDLFRNPPGQVHLLRALCQELPGRLHLRADRKGPAKGDRTGSEGRESRAAVCHSVEPLHQVRRLF